MTTSPEPDQPPTFLKRHWRLAAAGVVAVLVVTTTAIAFAGDDDSANLTIVNDETTVTSDPPPVTEPGTPATSDTTATTIQTATTDAKKSCKNGFDTSCGSQKWSPAPGNNAPLTAEVVSQSPKDPEKEDQVSITIRVKDADSAISNGDLWLSQYQGTRGNFSAGTVFAHKKNCPTRSKPFGEWTTPAKKAGSFDITNEFSPAAVTGFGAYFVLEAASDACSFIRSEGKLVFPVVDEPATPWFNPYASYQWWNVCFDETFHAFVTKESCPLTSWQQPQPAPQS